MSLNGSWIEISKGRLQENIQTFRGIIEPQTKLMVVVKANAYGHGLEFISGAIAESVDWFGVDSLSEALAIETVASRKPILILGHSDLELAPVIVERTFRQVVYRRDTLEALSGAAVAQGRTARIHLKVETGTNRQGIPLQEVVGFAQSADRLRGIEIEGIYTHFANIEDTLDPSFAQLQLERLRGVLKSLEEAGIRPPEIHAAATAGILLYPETHFTMVRLGIGAYGVWPSRETQVAARERGRQVTLKPIMTWKTRIAQLKTIEEGEYVGYGLSFQANRSTTLAIVPVGYYEGYDRRLSGSGRALIRTKSVPVVGRVAMNMLVLDVTDCEASLDDDVVLLGRQGGAEISADELADKIGTIAYEVLSRINPLLKRRACTD